MQAITMNCPNCGAKLEIASDVDDFACSYCGTAQRVIRKGGLIALKKIEAGISAVQLGTSRTAAELALRRLERELAELHTAWAEAIANDDARQTEHLNVRSRRGKLIAKSFVAWIVLFPVVAMTIHDQSIVSTFLMLGALGVGYTIYALIRSKPSISIRSQIDKGFEAEASIIQENIRQNKVLVESGRGM